MLTKTFYISDQFHINKYIEGYNLNAEASKQFSYDFDIPSGEVAVHTNDNNLNDFLKLVELIGLENDNLWVSYYAWYGYDFEKVKIALEVLQDFDLLGSIEVISCGKVLSIEGRFKDFDKIDKILKKCELNA